MDGMGGVAEMMGSGGMNVGGLDLMFILKYVAILLGGGALLGLVTGKIFAGIRYPNPEKRQLFKGWQKIVLLIITLTSIGLIAGGLYYQSKGSDDGLGDSMMAVGGADMDGMNTDMAGTEDAPATDGAGETGDTDETAPTDDASATESSSATTGNTNNAPAQSTGGGSAIIGGGAIAIPMF